MPKARGFRGGAAETYRWYLPHMGYPKPDYGFEDGLIESAPEQASSAPAD